MPSNAYEYCLNLLAARAYTTRNLRRKLVQKDFPPEEIQAAVDRLTAAGLLDDDRFASEYARQKLMFGTVSERRVRQELVSKGVSGDAAKAAIDKVLEEEPVDMRRAIDSAARKKLATMGSLDAEVKRRRLFAFLARRGFEFAEIQRVVAELFSPDGESS